MTEVTEQRDSKNS